VYGKVTQPNTPTVETSIYHGDGERDEYFSPRFYGFGESAYDSQFLPGLDLQQSYGAGIGWTTIRSANQSLDLKMSLSYVNRQFQGPEQGQNLFGSIFDQRYNRTLSHGVLFTQQISIMPSWNDSRAYAAVGGAGLTLPFYKRFSLAINALGSFPNDPPPGFRKNSIQFTTGLTYTLP